MRLLKPNDRHRDQAEFLAGPSRAQILCSPKVKWWNRLLAMAVNDSTQKQGQIRRFVGKTDNP